MRRDKCRFCENERKDGVEWYDDDYCSGKCKKSDGGEIHPITDQIRSFDKASLNDYILDYPKKLGEKDNRGQRIKGRLPKRYRRRFDADRLNWGDALTTPQLKQAGLRANREPIPGDWDFAEALTEENRNG